jgi:hypothetical protein
MARTALTVQQINRSGVTPSYTAANVDGHSIANDGTVVLHVKNGGASPINVTVPIPTLVDGQAVSSRVVAVANAGEKIIGPFPAAQYNQSAGDVNVDFSAVTSVTVAALRIG